MESIGVGLIGSGFMGKCHALAYGAVKAVFGDVPRPRLEVFCDVPDANAERFGGQFGFARATADWRDLVADPKVELVSITTPNKLHKEMALAAITAGKHVYCEKPMALTLADAEEMTAAANAAGVRTLVGYNYLRNPVMAHAAALIARGAIGERILYFRGIVDEDYMADGDAPWSWRCLSSEAGLGALGDMGCHLVASAIELVGPIESLIADMSTAYPTRRRPDGDGASPVENEDIATALVRFVGGAQGSISTSRAAWGRKSTLSWEVHGDRGMLAFDQERMNELKIFEAGDPTAEHGFKTILTGPAHPPYGMFTPAPGHQLSFNDQKTIEVAHLLRGIAKDEPLHPDFNHALTIERVIHAIADSARGGARVFLPTHG